MIIGNGDIASALMGRVEEHRKTRTYFASGVSNSKETRESEYEREASLLMEQPKDKHLVYFSSLSVFYKDSRYTKHKKMMERLVKDHFLGYTIVRLGNITWGTNPHTLINHFSDSIVGGKPINILDTTRYIIDEEEFLHWIKLIPGWSCEMNITGQPMTIKEIVKKYVL